MYDAKQQPTRLWPAKSKLKNTLLVFSGTFDAERVSREQTRKKVRLAGKILLFVILGFGAASLAASSNQGLKQGDWLFLLNQTPENLSFWVALFLSAYLWAQFKQEKLDQTVSDLLQWETLIPKNAPGQLDIYNFFNIEAKNCWDKALLRAKAASTNHKNREMSVSAIDLFMALMDDKTVQAVFFRINADRRDLTIFLQNFVLLSGSVNPRELDQIPFVAFNEALNLRSQNINPLVLLCALKILLPGEHVLQSVFYNIRISLGDLETVCAWQFDLAFLQDQNFTGYELKKLDSTDILLDCCIRASILETKNNCLFRYAAIKRAVELTNLYVKDKTQPGKTIALLVEAAGRAKSSGRRIVGIELIETIVNDKLKDGKLAIKK